MAQAWFELMRRLGYTRYVAQGGDVGAAVTDSLGRQAPEGVDRIHMNLLLAWLAGGYPSDNPSEDERAALAAITTFRTSGNGYLIEQNTRPQTIGYALLDSPVALAAWMLDHDTDSYYKISSAFVDSKPSGNLAKDHILDNITTYWLTATGATAARFVLGEHAGCRSGGRQASSGRLGAGRLHRVPRRDLPGTSQLGREVLSQPQLLQPGRQGWSLRRLGVAGAVLRQSGRGSRRWLRTLKRGSQPPGRLCSPRPGEGRAMRAAIRLLSRGTARSRRTPFARR